MRSGRAKVLHELGGQPLIRYPLATLAGLHPERVALVVGHQSDAVRDAALRAELADLRLVLQSEQRGTGHAVACAREAFADFDGDVLILYGDVRSSAARRWRPYSIRIVARTRTSRS